MDGYIKDEETRVWGRQQIEPFAYTDGNEVEDRLYKALKGVKDRRVFSQDLLNIQNDWPSLYHFNYARCNLLRPLKHFFAGKKVLELGCGLGAITRFLGESDPEIVHSIEGSLNRAKVAALRCKDLENVEVICDQFQSLKTSEGYYDVVTLIGVLEYDHLFDDSPDAAEKILKLAFSALNPKGGKLIIAIENKLGLKYFAGVPEDHLGYSFCGIEDAYRSRGVKTFSRRELETMFVEVGFRNFEQFLSLPDYKLPTTIVYPSGLNQNDINLSGFLSFSQRTCEAPPLFNLQGAWESVEKGGLLLDVADSLCYVVHKSQDNPVFDPNVFVKHYGISPTNDFRYSKEVTVKKSKTGEVYVERENSFSFLSIPSLEDEKKIEQKLENEKWIKGQQMESKIRKAFLIPNWTIEEISQAFSDWYLWLESHKVEKEGEVWRGKIPGSFWDATPANVIVDSNGEIHYIDREWRTKEDPLFFAVFVRSVYVTLTRLGTIAPSNGDKYCTIGQLVKDLVNNLAGTNLNNDDLRDLWTNYNILDSDLGEISGRRKITWDEVSAQRLRHSPRFPSEWFEYLGKLTTLSEENINLQSHARSYTSEIEKLHSEIGRLNSEIELLNRNYSSILQSSSWQVTKPIRKLVNLIKQKKIKR